MLSIRVISKRCASNLPRLPSTSSSLSKYLPQTAPPKTLSSHPTSFSLGEKSSADFSNDHYRPGVPAPAPPAPPPSRKKRIVQFFWRYPIAAKGVFVSLLLLFRPRTFTLFLLLKQQLSSLRKKKIIK